MYPFSVLCGSGFKKFKKSVNEKEELPFLRFIIKMPSLLLNSVGVAFLLVSIYGLDMVLRQYPAVSKK